MFFTLSKILDVLLSPLTWSVLLVLAGMRAHASTPRRGRGLTIAGVTVLLVFSLEPVANLLVRGLEAKPRPMPAPGTYDAVVLLGGALDTWATEDSGTRAYNGSVERVLAAQALLRRGVAPVVVISAGRTDPHGRVVEADVLRDELVDLGVAPAQIVREGRSRNTRENADETAAIVRAHGYRRLLLVTSAVHIERAQGEFARAGIRVDPYPVDVRSHDPSRHPLNWLPRASHLAESTGAIREYAGRLVYRFTR